MEKRSHVDTNKLSKVPVGHPFEYHDVVEDDYPVSYHTQDGIHFKNEVENGLYDNITITRDRPEERIIYKKI